MNDFVEECRREWRRLGVPDPIANEMAADLAADIEEAEAEGGSAEDVLGNSVFDPQRFAASWAGARGVTAPQPLFDEPPKRRGVLAVALAGFGAFFALAAVALLLGRRSASAAISVRTIFPGRAGPYGSVGVAPSLRFPSFGPQFVVQHGGAFVLFAGLMLLLGVVALGLAVMYWSPWSPWSRHRLKVHAREVGRPNRSARSGR